MGIVAIINYDILILARVSARKLFNCFFSFILWTKIIVNIMLHQKSLLPIAGHCEQNEK